MKHETARVRVDTAGRLDWASVREDELRDLQRTLRLPAGEHTLALAYREDPAGYLELASIEVHRKEDP